MERGMRHGTSGRHQRGRGSNNGGGQRRSNGPSRTQVFDSNGPDVRIRGTAHQVCEKYQILAKDAASGGDRVLAESYLQYAEHYQRIINSFDEDLEGQRPSYSRDVHPEMDVRSAPVPRAPAEDDLSLPSSILGAVSPVKSQNEIERTSEILAG